MAWIGAIAGLAGGAMNASAQTDAANQAAQQATAAANLQMQQYEQSMGYLAPSRNLGYGADNLLAQLYGMAPVYNGPASTAPPYAPGGTAPPAGAAAYYGTPTAGGNGGGIPYGTAAYPGATPSGYGNNLVTGYGMYANGAGGYSQSPTGGATYAKPTAASAAPGAAPASGAPDYSSFYNSPNYQFALQQGEQAQNRSSAAGGGLYSTNNLIGLDSTAQGLASQQYNTYVGQLNSMAGLGQNAVATGASAGTAAASGASNSLITAGMANASGTIGSAGALSSAATAAARAYSGNNLTGGALPSDPTAYQQGAPTGNTTDSSGYTSTMYCDSRLKNMIVPCRFNSMSGLMLYDFEYKEDPGTPHRGYIAQEVQKLYPEAVDQGHKGFLMIDYSKVPGWDELKSMNKGVF